MDSIIDLKTLITGALTLFVAWFFSFLNRKIKEIDSIEDLKKEINDLKEKIDKIYEKIYQ